nr:hypothetical protein [uncultured Cohaesibacter sp.]
MARYKQDAAKRWTLPDRTFFAHGACHILAGMYLRLYPDFGFKAKQIIPRKTLPGAHIFISNDTIAFDYHGYSSEENLLCHHNEVWRARYPDWQADIEMVTFDLLKTTDLNQRQMRGPDQYWRDVLPRARHYLEKIDHQGAYEKAKSRIGSA